ncbi:hypothetical protein BP6252_09865 [Coleophoma cylindrospora]|uniref:LIM zinc-binding domain-containing protein n=1 Tax=Coleophoma cylindrospora TaxID=1849047 RepID=A0A3D8QX04_9HELO|nr:hypothetical protein BP6252_09865 [Coleophoma cylindrospora]
MLLRGRSKDRNRKVSPPGPSYMSNEQFAEYLADLRNNRIARPSGARPQPSSRRRDSGKSALVDAPSSTAIEDEPTELPPRASSALAHSRTRTSFSNYSSTSSRTGRALVQQPQSTPSRETSQPLKPDEVVPSATYMERGQRWMEKEEAVALREAMEDMDLKPQDDDEMRIHAAAQEEASELVYQHQNPQSVPKPDAPYKYKEHLRKNSYAHARTQSVGRYGGMGIATGLARDLPPRSFSGSSSGSGGLASPRGRVSTESSDYFGLERNISPDTTIRASTESSRTASSQRPFAKRNGTTGDSRRRSSAKRNVSGEIAGKFTGEQIWEEPEQHEAEQGQISGEPVIPAPLRIKPRNPLNRVQFAQDAHPRSSSTPPETTKKLSKYEIHRNPPSQSRNPGYTANPPPLSKPAIKPVPVEKEPSPVPTMRDGLEIRSEEIRQATSMRLKDRSPKLPTPTVVSDKPGRPIVSFERNWKPKEADVAPDESKRSAEGFRSRDQSPQITFQAPQKALTSPVPTIQHPDAPSIQVNDSPSIPTINFPDPVADVPTINLPDIPTISISASVVPKINVPGAPSTASTRPLPAINLPGGNSSASSVPSINTSGDNSSRVTRPLPDPKSAAGRPLPRHHATAPLPRGHWSPAVGSRATATCHQCQLPIEGRVVSLRGTPERFHPQCFICFTCGTGLEALEISPEPAPDRAARIDRIKRRAQGENIEEVEGQTMAEDGDERLRFFCHLDWHERYAPRCKHCKTPIIGEHAVALGEHWHYGHFFCAECGDPFEKGMTHIEKDGYAWCLNCQTKRTERRAPKCKKCRGPVIGQYVQALGGEWHDACFRCAACNGGFEDGQIFPKQDGVVLCTGCMERELKA